MKKILALVMVLVCVFCWSFACAEGLDFASMSDEQLQAIIDGATEELANRKGSNVADGVLIDQDGVKLYLTGKHEVWGYDSHYLSLEAVVENNMDCGISIDFESVSINGWEVYGSGIFDTGSGKKQKAEIDLLLSDAEISTYEEIEEIEFVFKMFDSDTFKTIKKFDPVVLTF